MSSADKVFGWRIGYALFCLLYTGCVIYLALSNFHKVHSEYEWAGEKMRPENIDQTARRELLEECRRKTGIISGRAGRYRQEDLPAGGGEETCLVIAENDLGERQRKVAERLQEEKSRLKRKLVAFYISFAFFFILLPLLFLYLLLAFLIWLFKDMKFIR